MKLKTKAISVAIFLCLASFAKGFAGPPFLTDDPEPVEYKHWEFYLGSSYIRDKDQKSGTFPQVEVNYGLIPDLQIHLIAPVAFVHPEDSTLAYGYGDTELGFKYRFIHETEYIPQLGFFPHFEVPSGNGKEGLGNGKTQIFFPLWLQKSFGPWTAYGGGGYWYNPGAGNKNWTFIGWVLQRDISKMLTLGMELFYQTADKVDVSDSNGFNVGAVINLDERNHLLCSIGRDFRGQNRFMSYAAYQLTF
jgi:hypothetical protein